MINKEDILPYGRFKYPQPYTGSYMEMRYRIIHPKPEEGEENLIYIVAWPGPNCYEKTEEELKIKITFPYSQEGYDAIVPWLNETYELNRDNWAGR